MLYDALIVGGSYAGLSGAMQIARSGRSVCVVDGGQPRNRFATHSHGFFGQDGESPRQMIIQARTDLAAYPNVTLLDTLVTGARRAGDLFSVTLTSGDTLHARKLLLAYGVVDVLPELPGVAERWGQTVLHCPYCHGYEVRSQRLGVDRHAFWVHRCAPGLPRRLPRRSAPSRLRFVCGRVARGRGAGVAG